MNGKTILRANDEVNILFGYAGGYRDGDWRIKCSGDGFVMID